MTKALLSGGIAVLVACYFDNIGWAANPGHTVNGNACRATYGSQIGSFFSYGARLVRNTSDGGSTKWINCPIAFPYSSFDYDDEFWVTMFVTRTSGTITCGVAQYDEFGSVVGTADSATHSSG